MEHTLPALPYAIDALAPAYSKETLEFHHGKHHNAYVVNLNNLQKGTEFVYKLTLAATETTSGEVVVVDTLPSKLQFVESKDNTLQYANGKLTATIPQFGSTATDRTKVFEYKVKVKDEGMDDRAEVANENTPSGPWLSSVQLPLTLPTPKLPKTSATCAKSTSRVRVSPSAQAP